MKLVPNEEEQKVLEVIYKLRDRGLGYRKIAKQLEEYFPQYKGSFPNHRVKAILNRKVQGLH